MNHPKLLATKRRQGMTLLEVMLALLIMVIAISSIAGLVDIGFEASASAQNEAMAQILANSKMAEMSSGILKPTASKGGFEEQEDWEFEVQTENTETPGLLSVRVIVRQKLTDNTETPDEFHLVRLMVDPDFEADTAE